MRKIIVFLFLLILLSIFFTTEANAQVVINEFVLDADTEWIEFHNTSGSADYIKNYWIDDDANWEDDSGTTAKKPLSTLNVLSSTFPYFDTSSFLNNDVDSVVLFASDGTLIDQYTYTLNPGKDISIGRSPDITGAFAVLESTTKGSVNSRPKTTPTPTQTPAPTSSPTQIPTESPIPKPTVLAVATQKPTITPRPARKDSEKDGEDVLGLRDGLVTSPSSSSEAEIKKKFPFVAGLFLFGGSGLIGVAGYTFLKNGKKEYNKKGKVKESDGFNKITYKRDNSKESS